MPGLFYEDVLTALTSVGVRFVVVGGVALNLQGVPRFTADLDVAIEVEGKALASVVRALRGLGLRSTLPASDEELTNPETIKGWVADRNIRTVTFLDPSEPLREVDLVVESPVPFEELWQTADRMSAGPITVAVASIDALIRMKEGTGRAQDASDVDALRRTKEALRGR